MKSFKSGDAWVCELTELEWFGPNVLKDKIRKAADYEANQSGCSQVAIFVSPDPILPQFCEKRERVYFKRLNNDLSPISVDLIVYGNIQFKHWNTSCGSLDAQRKTIARVRDECNKKARGVAGRYVIRIIDADGREMSILERGRV